MLKALDDAPGFGEGNAAAGWHRYLDTLEREGGFRAPLLPEAIFAELERDLRRRREPVAPHHRAGRSARPRPRDRGPARCRPCWPATGPAREARIRRQLRELKTRLRQRTEQAALASFKEEFDAATQAIEARNDERPAARRSWPTRPLARDDAPFVRGQLPGGVPVVRTHFDSTVFTDAEPGLRPAAA